MSTPSRRRVRTATQVWRRRHTHDRHPGLTQPYSHDISDGIAWYTSGPEPSDAPVTVLFVHGYGLAAESFYDQVDFLRASYPRVRAVLLDLRGHGSSDRVPAEDCTVEDAADDVAAILTTQAPTGPLIIVGHSLGGMVVENLIRRLPAEDYERIAGVLLISTSMRPFAETGVAALLQTHAAEALYDAAQRLPHKVNRARQRIARIIAPLFAAGVTGYPRMERLEFHVDMLLDTPLDSFVGFFDDLVDHSELAAADRLAGLPGIVLVGSMDIVTPRSQSELICSHWPEAELRVVDGSGHMVILEEPEAVSQALAELIELVLAQR